MHPVLRGELLSSSYRSKTQILHQGLQPFATTTHALFKSLASSLLCSWQDKLQSWSTPFREAAAGLEGARWFELSLVESFVRFSPL